MLLLHVIENAFLRISCAIYYVRTLGTCDGVFLHSFDGWEYLALFSSSAERDVFGWAVSFKAVVRPLEWDNVRIRNQVPYLSGFASVWFNHKTDKGNKPFPSHFTSKDKLAKRFMPDDYKRHLKRRFDNGRTPG